MANKQETPEQKQAKLKKSMQARVDAMWKKSHTENDATLKKSLETNDKLSLVYRAAKAAEEILAKQAAPAPSNLSKKEQLQANARKFWDERKERADDVAFKYEE